jgi:hypothetical protein
LPWAVNPEEFTIVFLSRFDDAFRGEAPSAESRHNRVVLAPEHDYVRVWLVQVVLEHGEE